MFGGGTRQVLPLKEPHRVRMLHLLSERADIVGNRIVEALFALYIGQNLAGDEDQVTAYPTQRSGLAIWMDIA